jgi:hypothetical protein
MKFGHKSHLNTKNKTSRLEVDDEAPLAPKSMEEIKKTSLNHEVKNQAKNTSENNKNRKYCSLR